MIASSQITNNEFFAFMAVLVFKLLTQKFLFINRNCKKVGYFLRKEQISCVNYWKIINAWNAKVSGFFYNM